MAKGWLDTTEEHDSMSYFIPPRVYSPNTLEDEIWQQINISVDISGSSRLSIDVLGLSRHVLRLQHSWILKHVSRFTANNCYIN